MVARIGSIVLLLFAWSLLLLPASACCPAPPRGKPVVNADQTVILIWDAANQTQHFIRQASFKSQANDFGFLVPTPSQPELEESGNDAFPHLMRLTAPPVIQQRRPGGGMSCACSSVAYKSTPPQIVSVLQEKRVAGFDAVVLEAKSAEALVTWLTEHGYAFSPEVQAWAKPYIDAGWKITALKVAKDLDAQEQQRVSTAALRLTFQTDRPLFPYREPDSTKDAAALGARQRLLRIYFIGEARYQGELTKDDSWTGKVAWAGKLKGDDRQKLLQMLKLPEATGPAEWWLTEFEDNWPYRIAPADVTFARGQDQNPVQREAVVQYVNAAWPSDGMAYVFVAALFLPWCLRRLRSQ